MSRVEAIATVVSATDLAQAQAADEEIQHRLQNPPQDALRLQPISVSECDLPIYCDVNGQLARPFVPNSLRQQIFSSLHSVSHPGANASIKLVSQRYVWPGLKKDCRRWSRACLACQRNKISRHVVSPINDFPAGRTRRFEHIHVDIIGPYVSSRGYRYCLTVIDRFSRFPEAFPLEDTGAECVARKLFAGWICRYGVPLRITTDQGVQFESQLLNALSQLLGSKHIHTTTFHP